MHTYNQERKHKQDLLFQTGNDWARRRKTRARKMLDAREWPGHAADRVAVAAWVCGENEGWLAILSNASHMFGVHGRPIDSDATNDLTGFVGGQVDEEER